MKTNSGLLFPTAALTQGHQSYYKINFVFLPVSTVVAAV